MNENIRYPQIGIIRGLADKGTREAAKLANEDFTQATAKIRAIFSSFDPIHLLSRVAYFTIVEQQSFGEPDARFQIEIHELELLQALALSVQSGSETDHQGLSGAVEELMTLARENSRAFQRRALLRLTDDDAQNRRIATLERIRATTQTVRGPRHAPQTRAYMRDVAARLDGKCALQLGFTVSDFTRFFDELAFGTEEQMERIRNSARRWLSAANSERCLQYFAEDNPGLSNHPFLTGISAEAASHEATQARLWHITEDLFRSIFIVDRPDGDKDSRALCLFRALSERALRFGDISEDQIPSLHLANPVRLAPIIIGPAGEHYIFCTISAVAGQVEIFENILTDYPSLEASYRDFKARWLERKLHALVKNAFPFGKTIMNAKWLDASGEPGETDCILTIDKTVGLFEAKSGRITPPARRGAEERLERQIADLMVGPSRQSARFEKLLRSDPSPIEVNTPVGPAGIGGSETREVIRISVLFDTLGPLSACSRLLTRAGFIAPDEAMAPTMSIFELETVFALLPDQISKIHYLRRRSEIERKFTFEADELDLIALYLSNCFCIGELPPDAEGFSVYGWSETIARAFGTEVPRREQLPQVRRTPLWDKIMREVENRGIPGWTRFGYFLSNIPYRDQWTLQRLQEKLCKKARRLRSGQSTFGAALGSGEAPAPVIVLCAGNNVSEENIQYYALEATESVLLGSGKEEALVIFWDVTAPELPYTYIATMKWKSQSSSPRT